MSETREAGRALDAEVAEKFFGATWQKFNDDGWEALRPAECHDKPCTMYPIFVTRHRSGGVEYWPELPPFSSGIGAAWLVVEKMRADGFVFDIGSDGDDEWQAVFTRVVRRSTTKSGQANAPTPALAISRAALAALPVSGEPDNG